jgi:cysteine synthase A
MQTILALYPGSVTFRQQEMRRHRALLKTLGIRVVLADDYVLDSDREMFDEVIELPPVECVGETWSILDELRRTQRIDAVVAQSEGALLPGALLCQALGLPGISPRAAFLCTSKLLCRRELERAGVPQPVFALAHDAASVRAFARAHCGGYPIVLKGVSSALGRLVTLVRDEAAVDGAVERMLRGLAKSADIRRLCEFAAVAGFDLGCDPRREFLVESFAPGDPVETDGLVVGSDVRSFGVTEQVLSTPPRFFLEGYLLPADRPPHEIAAIEAVSDAALAALGVSNTGFSVEMRMHRGEPSIIEVNGRLGCDEGFGEMFEAVVGLEPELEATRMALGHAPAPISAQGRHAALAYSSCYADRIVERVPSAAEIADIAGDDIQIGLGVYAGCRMYAPPHPDVTPHLAYALATHPTSSRAAYASARAAVERLEFVLAPIATTRPVFAHDAR